MCLYFPPSLILLTTSPFSLSYSPAFLALLIVLLLSSALFPSFFFSFSPFLFLLSLSSSSFRLLLQISFLPSSTFRSSVCPPSLLTSWPSFLRVSRDLHSPPPLLLSPPVIPPSPLPVPCILSSPPSLPPYPSSIIIISIPSPTLLPCFSNFPRLPSSSFIL